MKKILWKLLELFDDNWGYSTPLQKRFKVGDKVKISPYKQCDKIEVHEQVKIIEFGRHDYLIEKDNGEKAIVYQFELC